MALVLDVATHPLAQRAELVHDVIASSGVRRQVRLNAPARSVRLRAETWRLSGSHVLRTEGTGLTLSRNEGDVRADAPEMVAVALSAGPCRYSVGDATHDLGPQSVVLVDFSTPYVFAHVGPTGSSFTTHLTYADLGSSVDDVRRAVPRVWSSPVYPLVRDHLRRLSSTIDDVAGRPAVAADVGSATSALVRALIASVADGGSGDRHPSRATVRAQVVAYVRAHLGERDLTPARIAAAHHISRRTLYTVWGDEDGGLVDWIVRERLERARAELAPPSTRTVSAVARRCGFADPTHFARRFRAAYGVSAQDWRRGTG